MASSDDDQDKINKLTAVYGVTEEEASCVLEESGGDVSRAASLLDDARSMNEEATNFNAGKNASKSLAANDAKLKPAELKVDEDASSSAKDDCLEYTPIATPARGATSRKSCV
jgi:hypothetical protein